MQKVVPLHRPEVSQIKSCRGLSTTIRKRAPRDPQNGHGFSALVFQGVWRKLDFGFSGFSGFHSFEPISKKQRKQSRQGHHSNFEFLGCKIMQGSERIGKKSKGKRTRERAGHWAPWGPWAPPLFIFLFDCFPIMLDPCTILQPRNSKFE